MSTCWLIERRDLFLKNMVKDFLESCFFFAELKEHTSKYGVRYEGLDFWVGTEQAKGQLWRLKDLCHLLWGDCDPVAEKEGFMLDWMVGAIFHEAMKLKENAYMMKRYRESYPLEDMAPLQANGNGEDQGMEFFEETAHEIHRAIRRIDLLVRHAQEYLIAVLKRERANALLVRYLLEARVRCEEQWSKSVGPERLLQALFPNRLDRAYCLAGESYLEGSWFIEARHAFEQALKINPDCQEAKSGLRLIEKRLREIAALLEKEYELQTKNGNSAKVEFGRSQANSKKD